MKNLVILAGGKSIRMGKDKVFLLFRNETFIERLYFGGQKFFDRIVISTDTKEHADEICKTLGETPEILLDKYPDTGPLGALCTIFEETGMDKFAILPVDVPNANMAFLLEQYEKEEKPIVIAKSDDGKYEPLIGVYSERVYPVLKDALDKGDYKVIRVIGGHYESISLNDLQKKEFLNVNTKEEYKELEQ